MEKQSEIFLADANLPCSHGPTRWNVRKAWEWQCLFFWEHWRVVPLLLPTGLSLLWVQSSISSEVWTHMERFGKKEEVV